MNKQQMARKIKDLKQRIEELETELQSVTGRILPMDVDAERLRPPGETPPFSRTAKIRFALAPPKTPSMQALEEYRDYGPIIP